MSSRAAPENESIVSRFKADPVAWVLVLCAAQLLLWTAIPRLLSMSLPLDVVTNGGIPWGNEWQWGYVEHPPLPSWLVAAWFDAAGDTGVFLLSQIAVVLTYVFVFLLGREIMPAKWAAAGTILLTGVYYFSIPTPEFNHGIAQLPLWAAAIFFYYKALQTRAPAWWLALGLAAGLGMLAKYSTGILLAVVVLHALSTARTRQVFKTLGPYLAIMVCLVVLGPHLAWLVRNHFPTIDYAVRRAGHEQSFIQRPIVALRFVLTQLLDIAPALAIAAIGGLVTRDALRRRPLDDDGWFLLALGIGPVLLTAIVSLVVGLGLRTMWGVPMCDLAGLLVVWLARERWASASLTRIAWAACGVFAIMLVAYVMRSTVVPEYAGKPSRTQWPDREIASTFSNAWTQKTHTPLRIVAGEGWIAGLVAVRAAPRPSIWTNASFAQSPWITPAELSAHGALLVRQITRHSDLAAPAGFQFQGEKDFAWPYEKSAPPLRVAWWILPPRAP
jgi:4-amino-4-deoxy-L-arabinose transferase-like glycosyltransferase